MKYFFIFLIFILTNCSQGNIVIPDNIISQTEMTTILTELHLAQSGQNDRTGKVKSEISNDDCLELVLDKHKMKREKFLNSLKFYSENPELLNEMYDSIVVKLNAPLN